MSKKAPASNTTESEEEYNARYRQLFWGKISGYPIWPCVVIPINALPTLSLRKQAEDCRKHRKSCFVKWFKENSFSAVSIKSLFPFDKNGVLDSKYRADSTKSKKKGLSEAIKLADAFDPNASELFREVEPKDDSNPEATSTSSSAQKKKRASSSGKVEGESASAEDKGKKRARALEKIAKFVKSLDESQLVEFVVKKRQKDTKKKHKKHSKKGEDDGNNEDAPSKKKQKTANGSAPKGNSEAKSSEKKKEADKKKTPEKSSKVSGTSTSTAKPALSAEEIKKKKEEIVANETPVQRFSRLVGNLKHFSKVGGPNYNVDKAVKTLQKLGEINLTPELTTGDNMNTIKMLGKQEGNDAKIYQAASDLLNKWKDHLPAETKS